MAHFLICQLQHVTVTVVCEVVGQVITISTFFFMSAVQKAKLCALIFQLQAIYSSKLVQEFLRKCEYPAIGRAGFLHFPQSTISRDTLNVTHVERSEKQYAPLAGPSAVCRLQIPCCLCHLFWNGYMRQNDCKNLFSGNCSPSHGLLLFGTCQISLF